MQRAGEAFRSADAPPYIVEFPSGAARNVTDQTFEIDDGMALENLRQAVGQAAHEAAARALVEFEVKMQFAIVAFLGIDNETDIIGSLFRIAEQRIEKIIGPLDGEKIIQTFRGKNVVYGHEGNLPCVGSLRNAQTSATRQQPKK